MSSESITEKVNDTNITSIRKQIELKQGYKPHYGTINEANSTVTDIDHFPYTRFYRGVPSSTNPILFEREAGWRPQKNSCYRVGDCNYKSHYPKHCFETACSTVYPRVPGSLSRDSDKDALNVQLKNSCIIDYR
jgi:hypothetical protein